MVSFGDIEAARKRLASAVALSPCPVSEALSARTGGRVWLKLENLQRTGSFKERGARNRLMLMSEQERSAGVICASAGNHAQGVAYHGARLGIDVTVVMPIHTPVNKVERTQRHGARVVLHGNNYDDAFEEAMRLCAQDGRTFVHPFDDAAVIAGQGTIGLELLEQNPYLEAVVVAVGGGGLAAGVAVAIKETNPRIRVYGVETAALPSMKRALEADHPVTVPAAQTIADGIAVRRAGALTFELVRKYVDDIVLVDEEEIAEAILFLLEQEKTVAEGAGAAPVAALLHGRLPLGGKKTAAVVCGGNIDVTMVARIIDRGLVKSGRIVRMSVTVPDVTGSLAGLTKTLADVGANIVQIHHERTFAHGALGEAEVDLVLETRGAEHGARVAASLAASGYRPAHNG
jgi:threonine dehydratase